jgi:hypothetical protein
MKIIKCFLASIVGIIAGSIINAGLIFIFNAIFGSPEGMDLLDAESVKAHADKLTTANYVGTLLAHQLGTLVGALVAAKIAPTSKLIVAFAVGTYFLLCGIYAASLIPAQTWFLITDFVFYIPFAFIGGKLGARINTKNT